MKLFNKYMQTCSALAIGGMLLASPAGAANTTTETYALQATVGNTSTISNITAGADNGLTFDGGAKSFTLDTASFINSGDATLAGANGSSSITFEVMSNYAHNVSLRSENDGMFVPAANRISVLSGTFLENFNYTATLLGGSVILTLNTADGASLNRTVTQAIAGANKATLTMVVSVNNTPANTPVVAGTYEDNLIVKVGATF